MTWSVDSLVETRLDYTGSQLSRRHATANLDHEDRVDGAIGYTAWS